MSYKFDPFVRYIAKSTYFIPDVFLVGNDCRILYTIAGKATFQTLSNTYDLLPGTLIYYPSGVPYKISSDNEGKFLFYTINFDFSCKYTDIAPMRPNIYHENEQYPILYTANDVYFNCFEEPIYIENAVWCNGELERILFEGLSQNEGYREVQSCQLCTLLIDLYRRISGDTEHRLCKDIKTLLSNNPGLSNAEIAEELRYHPFYINNIFKKHNGITIHKYALKQKLTRAYNLITLTDMTMDKIALALGFSSTSHFSTAFKEYYGVSPSKLRKLG